MPPSSPSVQTGHQAEKGEGTCQSWHGQVVTALDHESPTSGHPPACPIRGAREGQVKTLHLRQELTGPCVLRCGMPGTGGWVIP